MTLVALAFSMIALSTVSAAPNVDEFGGKSQTWTSAPAAGGQLYTNTHNGQILHWVPGLKSPHHVGLTTVKPEMNSNGAVQDTALPGASDVKPAVFWGPPSS